METLDSPWGLLLSENNRYLCSSDKRSVTVGSSDNCDLVVKVSNVESMHFSLTLLAEEELNSGKYSNTDTIGGPMLSESGNNSKRNDTKENDDSASGSYPSQTKPISSQEDEKLWVIGLPSACKDTLPYTNSEHQNSDPESPESDQSQKELGELHHKVGTAVGSHTVVVLRDHSVSGTFVNGKLVGKDRFCRLKGGDDIALVPIVLNLSSDGNNFSLGKVSDDMNSKCSPSPGLDSPISETVYMVHFFFHLYLEYYSTNRKMAPIENSECASARIAQQDPHSFGEASGAVALPVATSPQSLALIPLSLPISSYNGDFSSYCALSTEQIQRKTYRPNSVESDAVSFALDRGNWLDLIQWGPLIGKGSFGSVYLCINLENGSMCAVKVLRGTERPLSRQKTLLGTIDTNGTHFSLFSSHSGASSDTNAPLTVNCSRPVSRTRTEDFHEDKPLIILGADPVEFYCSSEKNLGVKDTIRPTENSERDLHGKFDPSGGTQETLDSGDAERCATSTQVSFQDLVVADNDSHSCGLEWPKGINRAHLREMLILTQLRHPRIVSCYGFQYEPQRGFCILMEYIAGGTLESVIKKFGSFEERVVRLYTMQILEALEYLNRFGVVHGDLKSNNILLTDKGCVKVADFGSSRILHEAHIFPSSYQKCRSCGNLRAIPVMPQFPSSNSPKEDINLRRKIQKSSSVNLCSCKKSATNSIPLPPTDTALHGTPLYMSPDLIRSQVATHASDIWALGCVVYEMVTGTLPWENLHELDAHAQLYHIGSTTEGPSLESLIELRSRSKTNSQPTSMQVCRSASRKRSFQSLRSVCGDSVFPGQPFGSASSSDHNTRLKNCSSTDDLIDFLRLTFEVDSVHRPSASELLKHPFIIGNQPKRSSISALSQTLDPSVIASRALISQGSSFFPTKASLSDLNAQLYAPPYSPHHLPSYKALSDSLHPRNNESKRVPESNLSSPLRLGSRQRQRRSAFTFSSKVGVIGSSRETLWSKLVQRSRSLVDTSRKPDITRGNRLVYFSGKNQSYQRFPNRSRSASRDPSYTIESLSSSQIHQHQQYIRHQTHEKLLSNNATPPLPPRFAPPSYEATHSLLENGLWFTEKTRDEKFYASQQPLKNSSMNTPPLYSPSPVPFSNTPPIGINMGKRPPDGNNWADSREEIVHSSNKGDMKNLAFSENTNT